MAGLVTEKNVFRLYREALEYTNNLTQSFPEFQRIGLAQPSPDLPAKYPRVATGDTAAWMIQKSRTIIQQVPNGLVKNEASTEWLDIYGQFTIDHEIIPNATEDYDVLEKAQHSLKNAFNFGCAVTSAPSYIHPNGEQTPDMTTVYWGDLVVPAGYKSINAMPYVFQKGWWPNETIDALLGQKDLAVSGWNVDNLKDIRDQKDDKDEQSRTPEEKKRGSSASYAEVVVCHQDGKNAPVIIFSPNSKLILRSKPNSDPRGKKNIQVLYGWTDGVSELGYSVIALVGAWQNLMDNDAQAYQYYGAYNVDPAMLKIGDVGDGELHPGAEFKAQDSSSDVKLLELTSQSIASYPELYAWQKSVLINMLNSPNSVGDPNAPLGKTPTGISRAVALTGADDLAITNHVHDWFEDWAEAALNIYFTEHKGIQKVKLDEETAEKLRQLAVESPDKFDAKMLGADNVLTIDYDQEFPIFRYEVESGSSKVQDDALQLKSLQQLLEAVTSNPQLMAMAGNTMIAQIHNRIVTLSGIHDSESLHFDIDKLQKQEQQDSTAQTNTAKASVTVSYKDLEPAARVEVLKKDYGIYLTEAQLSGTEAPNAPADDGQLQAVMNALLQNGVPEKLIPEAIQALNEGVPITEIIKDAQDGVLNNVT